MRNFFEVPEDAGFGVGCGAVVAAFEEVARFSRKLSRVAYGFGLGGDEGLVEWMGV
jgi:hypothetical protein